MIKVLSSVGMKAALEQLKPAGCLITYATAVPLKRRIDDGERFDVAILPPALIEDLVTEGKAQRVQVLAKSCMGVGIRQGAPKPDLSSAESFKRALLSARSIAYSKEGQSGIYMAGLLERLDLGEKLAAKTILETRPGGAAFNLAEGKAELAFTIMSEIIPVPAVEIAGPLPAELAHWVMFAAGIAPTADRLAAKAFVETITAPRGMEALRANGLEPA